jgi:hypothetical protein
MNRGERARRGATIRKRKGQIGGCKHARRAHGEEGEEKS